MTDTKTHLMIMMAAALSVAACHSAKKAGGSATAHLVVESKVTDNPARLVVLKRSELVKKVAGLTAGKYIIVKNGDQPVVVQHDDLDGDGSWDEAAFLVNVAGDSKKVLDITTSDAPATMKAVVRAHVRHMHKNADNTFGPALATDAVPAGQAATDFSKTALPPFLTEGPAWENDKVGFRIYFDVRNGKDIWGKTTARMVLDEVGADPSKSYHNQSEWGMDILKVGKSLAAGSLALLVKNDAGKDTLVRLGNANMGPIKYTRVVDGPVRAIFRMQYPAWKVLDNAAPVSLTEEISIWGGQYFYESKVTMEHAPKGAELVTGIANFYNQVYNLIGEHGHKVLYTYGKQSENKDNLGMAVMASDKVFDHIFTTPNAGSEVLNTYAVAFKVGAEPVTFRFYVGWQPTDAQFASQAAFNAFLHEELSRATSTEVKWQ